VAHDLKRERLRRDGATVVEVQLTGADWVVTDNNLEDVLTKFQLWEFTEYEKIAFLDGHALLNQPLDDPAAVVQETLSNNTEIHDEALLPSLYVFAGAPDMSKEHHFPPISQFKDDYMNDGYLNADFF